MGVHRKEIVIIEKFLFVLYSSSMYTKYNYTYKSILFVLYSYTCMYTKYNYTYKSMLFVLYSYTCMYAKYNYTYRVCYLYCILIQE